MKILSLDGGGLKGVYTLKMLIEIKKEFNIDFTKEFDIIIGTSTGAIIAALLSLGRSPEYILDIYMKHSATIFDINYNKTITKGLFSSIYDINALTNLVNEELSSYSEKDLKTKLIIPSFNLTDYEICIYKNYSKNKLKLTDAIIASSSAPIYFEPYNIGPNVYVDGSIYANNPSLIGLTETFNLGEKDLENIKILSIGTGYMKLNYTKEKISNKDVLEKLKLNSFVYDFLIKSFKINEDKIGLLSIFKPLLLATIDSLAQFSDYMLKSVLKEKNYIRINDDGDNLKLNLIPESLLVKASESFKIKYKDKLKIFFKEDKKSYYKNLLLRISKFTYKLATKGDEDEK